MRKKNVDLLKKLTILLTVILVACFFTRSPICTFKENEVVLARFMIIDLAKHDTQNFTLSPDETKAVANILLKKAWYVKSDLSDFFLAQNYVPNEVKSITLYSEEMSLEITENGVIRNISKDEYAYINPLHNTKKGKEIYDAIFKVIEGKIS